MKPRHILLIVSYLISFWCSAQPPEITYLGNLIHSGYVNDESYGPFNIGFNFTFFGNSYSEFYVSTNGLVTFGAGSTDGTNVSIPAAGIPDNFIAPFWDDLTISFTGKVLYTTIGAAPNRKLTIQFLNMNFYNSPALFGTFSVILYENTNVIQVQYRLIVDNVSTRSHGGTATIGLENSTGTEGVQYSYNNPTAISNEQAISFSPSGSTYTINSNAVYDGIYLTSNLSLPEPGITTLVTPPPNAAIGANQTFQWAEASDAASYILYISHRSDLTDATTYSAGSNLTYDITGLTLDTTYYWGVFATNATGTTWCEIKKFTTSSTPPLAPVPQTIWTEQPQDKAIKLQYSGGDASPKTAIITSLPLQGQLYQYNAGVRGSLISSVPATITDAGMNVIYAATGSAGNGAGNFNFKIHDASGDSPAGTLTINVSPPGVPNVLYVAKSTNVEIQFDMLMADPAGKQNQFIVTVNGTLVTINSASLKTGDPYTILLTLNTPLTGTETVLVSYTQGNVTGGTGGFLFSFTDHTVPLTAQTITFSQSLSKKYSDSPFTLTATASSGLGMTYSSSNMAVAIAASNVLTFLGLGTSDITAHQAGDATYAPVNYFKPLTVAIGDQVITFDPLPAKTYGDANFSPGATTNSGLTIAYSSDNPLVATIVSGNVHITGTGTAVITASQGGNSLWNPAPDVFHTLSVSKAGQTITFNALPAKIPGDIDFSPGASASSDLPVSYASNNPGVASIVGGMIHVVGVGTAVITASQAGNANYNAAADVPQTLIVNITNQTITFPALPAKAYADIDFNPGASASSGLPVSYASNNPGVATIVGGMIHIVSIGSAVITASQAGDANYTPAADVPQALTVNKANQTITFGALSPTTYGGSDINPGASASSGLTVTYASGNTGVATIVSGMIHIVAAGTAVITASQAGNTNYNAAANVPQTLVVNKANQTITFSVLSAVTYGAGDVAPGATASSGLAVSYLSGTATVATIVGGMIHITGGGTSVITASQAGNANFNAAPDVQRTFTVNKVNLTFTAENKTKVYLQPNPALTYTISGFVNGETQSVIDVLPSIQTTALLNSIVGTYPIIISAGNDNSYNFLYIAGTLTITRNVQTITFTDTPQKLLVGDSYTLVASSTSGLTVLFESKDTQIATVSGNQLTGVTKGNVQIRAYHPGDQNYFAAEAFATVEIYSTHKDIMYLFTPNGDGFNDLWELPNLVTWGKCNVKVYNRWGKLVFADANYNNLWDGTSNGSPLPEGPYYFIIKTENAGTVTGTVNIVR